MRVVYYMNDFEIFYNLANDVLEDGFLIFLIIKHFLIVIVMTSLSNLYTSVTIRKTT